MNLIESCPSSEFSADFLQYMLNRMTVSYHKYGRVVDAYPDKVDAIKSLLVRLKKYEESGNTEWLVDVANFCMIEFMRPSHANAHFQATDSTVSPGRVFYDTKAKHLDNEGNRL